MNATYRRKKSYLFLGIFLTMFAIASLYIA